MPEEKRSARDKIIAFFENIPANEPVAIREIENKADVSWPIIKQVLQEGDLNIHFKRSAHIWIAWKSTAHVGKKSDGSCAKFLKEPEPTAKN